MEDRLDSGLWLEMTDRPQAEYSVRAGELADLAGVERAWWFSNANPRRSDLPARIPEFSTLGLFELGAGFVPPPTPEDVRPLEFKRTRRPGQGVLTGQPTRGLLLVLVSPRSPEGAQSFRDWADFVHIRHIAAAAVPGYTMITPYEQVGGGDPRFMHLYEMDSEDPEAAFASMTPLVQDRLGGPGSPAFEEWASHPQLRIVYVNTFVLEGVLSP